MMVILFGYIDFFVLWMLMVFVMMVVSVGGDMVLLIGIVVGLVVGFVNGLGIVYLCIFLMIFMFGVDFVLCGFMVVYIGGFVL